MHYTYFEIENFKGIRLLRLDLSGPSGHTFALVGLNESGKTTILEAIDFFTRGTEEIDPKELAGRLRPNENDLVPIAERANFNGTIRIRAGNHLDQEDIAALQSFMLHNHSIRLSNVSTDITVTDEYHFTNSRFIDKKTLWPTRFALGRGPNQRKDRPFTKSNYADGWNAAIAFLRGRMPPIWYFPNFLFDFPNRIFLRPQQGESAIDKFYRALLQDVLDALDLDATIEDHLLARAISDDAADKRALDNLILLMARRLSSDVFDAWKRILQREVHMRVALSIGKVAASQGAGEDEPYVEVRIEDHDGFYLINERSLGFRWFFVFLLLTTFRGSRRDSSSELLFLFDEPASNLHSSAQAQLLSSLGRLAARVRVIYTTHSHHLINPDWLEQTFVVRNKAADPSSDMVNVTARQTDIAIERYRSFAAQHPEQSHYFQPVLDVLNYVPSRLELVDELVLVEGKNDFYILRYADGAYGPSAIHLYPGGGAGSLDNVIALYLAWARNFVVLLDSDTEGKRQRARYVERFGTIIADRIFLLEDFATELSGKALDAIFDAEDRRLFAKLIGLTDEVPSKKAFLRLMQEAVAMRTVVPVRDEVKSILLRIQEGLRRVLSERSEREALSHGD